MSLRLVLALTFCCSLLPSLEAQAQTAPSFYKGKTLRFIVGTDTVGSYDSMARQLAIYLPTHLAGAPSALVENMVGASSAKAAAYVQKVAPADGTVFGFVQPYLILNKLFHPELDYDPTQLAWVARLAPLEQIGFAWRTSPARTIEEAKKTEINLGSDGASGPAAMAPWSLNRMIGTRFHVVMGYSSSSAQFLAMQQGELQGMGAESWSTILTRPDWLANNWVVPLYAISQNRLAQAPKAPTIVELTQNPKDRAVAELLVTAPTVGITMIAPLGVPKDRLEAIRTALAATSKDPAFLNAIGKIDLKIDLLSGDEVARLVTQTMQAGPDLLQALRENTAPMR